jgi:hypothetical protein
MPSTTPQQPPYRAWGHDISSPKPDNTTRLYYKNTNSIGTRAFTNRMTTLYQHHKELTSHSMWKPTQTGNNQPQNISIKHTANKTTTMSSLHIQQETLKLGSGINQGE